MVIGGRGRGQRNTLEIFLSVGSCWTSVPVTVPLLLHWVLLAAAEVNGVTSCLGSAMAGTFHFCHQSSLSFLMNFQKLFNICMKFFSMAPFIHSFIHHLPPYPTKGQLACCYLAGLTPKPFILQNFEPEYNRN